MVRSSFLTGFVTALVLSTSVLALATPSMAEVIYNRGNSGDPETLDPHKNSTVNEANIMRDIFEGLVIHDAKGKVANGLATSWTINTDGTVYTFKLRADGKWSNGDKVTAGDFVFALRRLQDPATGSKYSNVLYCIKNAAKINKGEAKIEELGAKAIDDTTLEITLEAPTPYFVELLTHHTALPLHPASVTKFGKDFVKPENFVTNGAFMVKEVVPADHIKLVKNPNFHDAASVKIDTVNYIPTEDRSAALRRFQAGELHSNDDVPTDQLKFIREKLGAQFRTAPYLGTYYFALNNKKPGLSDPRVRQALSMVIDREFLADEIWGGTMVAGYSFVPAGIGNYDGGPSYVTWKDMSPLDREEAAKKLLKEAGYGPGLKPLKVEIRYNTSENHKKTSVALADMWKVLGVETTFVNADLKTHYSILKEGGDYDVARAGWIADYSDPQNFLFLMQSDNKGLNYAHFENAEFDGLMKAAEKEVDLAKRAALFVKAEAIILKEMPNLPLLYYASKNLVSPKVVGFENNLVDEHPTRFLSLKD